LPKLYGAGNEKYVLSRGARSWKCCRVFWFHPPTTGIKANKLQINLFQGVSEADFKCERVWLKAI